MSKTHIEWNGKPVHIPERWVYAAATASTMFCMVCACAALLAWHPMAWFLVPFTFGFALVRESFDAAS